MTDIVAQVREAGYAVVPDVLTAAQVAELVAAISAVTDTPEMSDVRVHALRNLLGAVPLVRELAASAPVAGLVQPHLGPHPIAVRGIFFDKVAGANWKVPWHQDLSIAVGARHGDVEREDKLRAHGFGPWSTKEGVLHLGAPAGLLETMLTVRLHLDECDASNGPLRVLPGTHRLGKLSAAGIARERAQRNEMNCEVPVGGVLLMKPLLLHASSASLRPGHRRVVHLEFAPGPLMHGLSWHDGVARNDC